MALRKKVMLKKKERMQNLIVVGHPDKKSF